MQQRSFSMNSRSMEGAIRQEIRTSNSKREVESPGSLCRSNIPPWYVLHAKSTIFFNLGQYILKYILQLEISLDTKEWHLAVNTTLRCLAPVTNSLEYYYLKIFFVLFFVRSAVFLAGIFFAASTCWMETLKMASSSHQVSLHKGIDSVPLISRALCD